MRKCDCAFFCCFIICQLSVCSSAFGQTCSDKSFRKEDSGKYSSANWDVAPGALSRQAFPEKQVFEGFYVGLGITHNRIKSRVTMDDNMSQLAYFGSQSENNPGPLESNGDPSFLDNDDNCRSSQLYCQDTHDEVISSSNISRFGENISLGYGRFFSGNSWFTDNCYAGIETVVDIIDNLRSSQNHVTVLKPQSQVNAMDFGRYTVKYGSFVPTVAFRFGGYISPIDSLLFLRLGYTYMRYKMESGFFPNQKMKGAIFTPILGIGIEKSIADGFSVKTEVDYRFKTSKVHKVALGNFLDGPNKNYKALFKHCVRGYTVRLVGVYHFNLR